MTHLLLAASLFIIWFIGWINAVQMLSNDPSMTHIKRTAILIGCMFWPVAIGVAIIRIVFGIGSGEHTEKRK